MPSSSTLTKTEAARALKKVEKSLKEMQEVADLLNRHLAGLEDKKTSTATKKKNSSKSAAGAGAAPVGGSDDESD